MIQTILAIFLLVVSTGISAIGAQELPGVVRRLLPSKGGYERIEIKADAAFWKKVEKTLGAGTSGIKEKNITVFRAIINERTGEGGGYVIFTAARGMHGIVYMAVGAKKRPAETEKWRFAVTGVEILKHSEIGGAKATGEEFLGEFRGKTLDELFTGNGGADAVSGATVSSRAIAGGIKKSLAVLEAIFGYKNI